MTKAELKSMSNVELLNSFYWLSSRITNEVNSNRGLTKKTIRKQDMIVKELGIRFNIDVEELNEMINK